MKFFSAFLLVCAFTLLTGRAGAQDAGTGTIKAARVRGEVSVLVKATNVRTPLVDNADVSQGSIVTTAKDASVVLVFSNGATINLGTDSSLDIEQFTQDPFSTPFNPGTAAAEPSKSTTKLNLTRGELVGKVAKLKKEEGSSFTVSTPVGAAGIRGTVFRIVFRPDGNGKASFSLTVQVGDVAQTFNGSVTGPISVTDNKEISSEVDIQTSASGVITATLPNGQVLTVRDASAESLQSISAAVQAIAQSVFSSLGAPAAPPGPQVQTDDVTPLAGR